MNLITNFSLMSAYHFSLILVRVTGIFMASPVFTSRNIPNQVKIALSLLLSLILFPMVRFPSSTPIPQEMFSFFFRISQELVIGLVIGFIFTMIFAAIQLAGHLIDVMIGFGLANIVDPVSNLQISVLGQFYYLVAMLVFLTINGHHLLIRALFRSFTILPPLFPIFSSRAITMINDLFAGVFTVAFEIGAPVLAALFITDIVLGILARTVPQMNVLMIGFPLKIFVGMSTIILVMPFFVRFLDGLFDRVALDAMTVLRAMRVG